MNPIRAADGLSEETTYFFSLAEGNHDVIPWLISLLNLEGPSIFPTDWDFVT